MTQGRGPQRLLDESWTRVDDFKEAGPSSRSQPAEAMQIDEEAADGGDRVDGEGEWEYEDTVELVTLDLGPESKRLLKMSHQYCITGLETDTPFFQLGNVVFKGHWDQLIGTEIILQDHRDSSKPPLQQHTVQPLPPTRTDLRTGRAPSTTQHRIQFLPAVNMVAREQQLKPSIRGAYQPSITHRGAYTWVRDHGWIRKDQLGSLDLSKVEVDEVEDVPGQMGALANGAPPKKKMGRKKMTLEERFRYNLWRSLRRAQEAEQGTGEGEQAPAEKAGDEAPDNGEDNEGIQEMAEDVRDE